MRLFRTKARSLAGIVSIHAPPEGRDVLEVVALKIMFQSTRPRRGAMLYELRIYDGEGRFNPRAPGGARCLADKSADMRQ